MSEYTYSTSPVTGRPIANWAVHLYKEQLKLTMGICRPQRMEVVRLFAQAVYLLFLAVYICKKTVEHLLLTSSDSHHHHRTDEYDKFILG